LQIGGLEGAGDGGVYEYPQKPAKALFERKTVIKRRKAVRSFFICGP
jgi:hypothetical protein